jgi:acetyl-CoA synthetase
MTNSDRFIALRDGLLHTREDWQRTCREFRWPQFERFNWVADYFEVIAAGNDATALRMVDDAGADRSLSFETMAARAAQVAAFLAAQGVERGDRLLVMLPNCLELWEAMLAAIRGAARAAKARRRAPPAPPQAPPALSQPYLLQSSDG